IKQVFEKDPKAKIFVHCGRAHSGYRFFARTNKDHEVIKMVPSLAERFEKDPKIRTYSIRLSRAGSSDIFGYATTESSLAQKKFIIKPKNDYERYYVYRQDAIFNLPILDKKKDNSSKNAGGVIGDKEDSKIGQKDCSSVPCIKE
ncbi:MAG TPA: hypothetical protein PK443_05530, partial [bacterium]|nr:hypothetical protein [bacterium]